MWTISVSSVQLNAYGRNTVGWATTDLTCQLFYLWIKLTRPDVFYTLSDTVGGGTAGSVVSARLVQSGARVLVLEAGGPAPPESSVPGFIPLLLGSGSDVDWHIKLAPQRYTQLAFENNVSVTEGWRIHSGIYILLLYIIAVINIQCVK